MKKRIEIEYEVTCRISADLEVDEKDFERLIGTGDIDTLDKYGIRADILWDEAIADGWAESDYCVTDEEGKILIPWSRS